MGAEAFNRGPEKDWGSDVKTKFGTLRSQQRNFSGSFCDDGRNTDYFLFSNWKKSLQGTLHRSDGDIIEAVEGFFESKNKTVNKTGISSLML